MGDHPDLASGAPAVGFYSVEEGSGCLIGGVTRFFVPSHSGGPGAIVRRRRRPRVVRVPPRASLGPSSYWLAGFFYLFFHHSGLFRDES